MSDGGKRMYFVVERTAGDVVRYKTTDIKDAASYTGWMSVADVRRAGEGRNNANVSSNGQWAVFWIGEKDSYLW